MASPTYSVEIIAKLLVLTPRRVQQLTKEGVLPKAERGRYELAPVVQAYVKYLRDRNIGAEDPAADIGAFRARLVKAKARAAEIEVEGMDGTRLMRSEVERAWQAILIPLRAAVLALPTRAAAQVAAAETPNEAREILKHIVNDLLEILSGSPVYAERDSAGEDGAVDDVGAESAEAAADADGEPVG
jgi:phage terminase Nu1 subunit (DNA packaging protein)